MNNFDELYRELSRSPDYVAEHLALTITGIIRCHMRRQGITQEALAQKLGVTQANIAKKLRGSQNLTIRSIAEISVALDAEWVGAELVPSGEARAREQRAAWARTAGSCVAPFRVSVKGLSDEEVTEDHCLASCA